MTIRSLWAIVPAAGSGSRMQADRPKQYLELLGRPLLLHTLDRIVSYPHLQGVMLGLAPDDQQWTGLEYKHPGRLEVYVGGSERARTVHLGLQALARHADPEDWVLVHDAARPCLRHADLDALLAVCQTHDDGALLAVPLSDTLKRSDPNGQVRETIPRAGLWRALTPQVFRVGALMVALDHALQQGLEITDEASAMELSGARPRLVHGSSDNIKVTVPEDLTLAALILQSQLQETA